jgi:hypothetical protein
MHSVAVNTHTLSLYPVCPLRLPMSASNASVRSGIPGPEWDQLPLTKPEDTSLSHGTPQDTHTVTFHHDGSSVEEHKDAGYTSLPSILPSIHLFV